jgi:hypothetical protein
MPKKYRRFYKDPLKDELRAERMFNDGRTERPHHRKGTKTDASDFRRAFVCAAHGDGPKKFRDTRHPDLKRKIKRKTSAGLPGNVVKKYGYKMETL